MKTSEIITALRQAAGVIEAESEVIQGVHEYAHANGCSPGRNVFEFLLEDAQLLRTKSRVLDPIVPKHENGSES